MEMAIQSAKSSVRADPGAALQTGKTLLYAPLFFMWLIALLPKEFQLAVYALFAVALVVKLGKDVGSSYKIGLGIAALLALVGVQIIAIVLNSSVSSTNRIMAAINTVAIWLISIFFLFVYSYQSCNLELAAKAATLNILICVVLAFVASQTNLSYTLMGDTRQLNLVNWFGGSEGLRFAGFLDYSNLITLIYLTMLPLSLLYARQWKGFLLQCAYCLVATYPVVAASSRSGMLLSAAVLLMAFAFIATGEESRLSVGTVVALGVIFIAIVLIGNWEYITAEIQRVLSGRSGSDSTRSELYATSIEDALTASPFIGRGIKLVVGRFGEAVPLGSHSTYIGILYKTGLLGCFLAFVGLVGCVKDFVAGCLDRRSKLFVLAFAAVLLVFLAVEDIDGANWAIATVFVVTGMFIGRGRQHLGGE